MTRRNKAGKELVFLDLRQSTGAGKLTEPKVTASSATPAVAGPIVPASALEVVVSAKHVDAATVQLARAVRLGDCVEVTGTLEPGRGGGVGVRAEGSAPSCVRVVSRWADTHGTIDYATWHSSDFRASSRSKSKQGRKAAPKLGPDGKPVRRRAGGRARHRQANMKSCRAVVAKLDTPVNGESRLPAALVQSRRFLESIKPIAAPILMAV